MQMKIDERPALVYLNWLSEVNSRDKQDRDPV